MDHEYKYIPKRGLKGPFKKVLRDGDSTWSAATEEELEAGLA